jgi:methionyl-tRNA formyltransferase
LLPKYRGAAPAAWTIINGEKESGITTMQLVEKMDAGDIYLQRSIAVARDETTGSLQSKLTPIGSELLLETLRRLKDGSLCASVQDESLATLAPLLKKDDGLIDWTLPALEIERRVRGLDPWPGAFTYVDGKLLKIHRTKAFGEFNGETPGIILRADAQGFWISAGLGALSLEEVQLENRKRLSGIEFIRGARLKAGDRLQ